MKTQPMKNMKKDKVYVLQAGGNPLVIETERIVGEHTNERIVQDAKAISEFLIANIPSATFDEVVRFLKAYEKNSNLFSFGDEFQKHFKKRIKALNKEEKSTIVTS